MHNGYQCTNGAANGNPYGVSLSSRSSAGTLATGNTFPIVGVRQGSLSVKVTDILNPTSHGSAYALTAYENEETTVDVRLVATGDLCGVIYLSNGTTPAAGARVAVKPVSEGWRLGTDRPEPAISASTSCRSRISSSKRKKRRRATAAIRGPTALPAGVYSARPTRSCSTRRIRG